MTPAAAIWSRRDPNVPLLVAGVLAMTLLACDDWFFDPIGSIDPYKYVGLFLDYGSHAAFAPDDYKVSRLSWVLPGYVTYSVLGPVAGHYALLFTFLSATAVFLYLTLRSLFTRGIALLVAAIYLTCPWFHGPVMSASGGWAYHNAASLAYYWAAFYFLLTGAASGRVVHLLLSGASLALCVWTTIFMAPFVVLLLPVVWAIAPVPRVVRRAAWIGAGATLATLGLAAVNVALGGRFLFFAQELTYTLAMSRENIWFQPLPSYLTTAYWLVYPVLTVFLIVVAWACSWCWRRALDSRERRKVLAVQAQFLVLAGCLVVLSTSLEQSVLQFSFMVMPLAGPMMPALASALFVSWRRVATPGSLAVSTVVLAIMVGSSWFVTPRETARLSTWIEAVVTPGDAPVLVALAGGAALLLLVPLFGAMRVPLVSTAVAFAAIQALSSPFAGPLSRHTGCCTNRDAFEAIVEANGFLARADPAARINRFIYAMDEFLPNDGCEPVWLSQLFHGVYATRFSPRVYDWADLHKIGDDIQAPGGMILLAGDDNRHPFTERLVQLAKANGTSLRVVASRRISSGPFEFTVTLLDREP